MKYIKHYIIEKNKEAVIVTDSGEYPIWIRDFEKSFCNLVAGEDIADVELLTSLAVKREIKKKAIRRLAMGDITNKELSRRLMREHLYGAQPEAEWVGELLDKLERAGYIDDSGFALRYATKCIEKLWGELRIKAAMHEKGFSSEHISQALEKLSPDYVSMARDYIEKQLQNAQTDAIYRKLLQRGYKTSQISQAIEELSDND